MATKNIISPKGSAVYPWLTEPDFKFNPDGDYKTGLTMSAEDAAPFIEQLEEIFDAAHAEEMQTKKLKKLKKADMPWEENDDGTVTFKFKLKHRIKAKKSGNIIERKVALFDAKNKPVNPKTIKIGSGSVLKISFQPYTWPSPTLGFGLQLQINAVQILELSEGNGNRDYGFGEEEGFDGEDLPQGSTSGNFAEDDGEGSDDAASEATDEDEDF